MKSLNDKIVIGTFWTLLGRLSIKSIGLVSTIILARILYPEDFGLLALTMTLVAFFEIFSNFSFELNIIKKETVTDDTLNSAWTCKIIAGLILSCVIFLASDYAGEFFGNEKLPQLVSIVAFLPLINSIENIGFVLYRKNIDLKKEFTLGVVSKIVAFIVTITAALLLKNYWALVMGMFTNAIVRILLTYLLHPYRPKLSLVEAKELISFSKWLLLNNVLIFLNHKVTDLMIGKQSNSTELGYYSVGYEISNLPTTELVFPLSRAMFPAYAKLQNDIDTLRDTFIKFTQIIMFVAAPICFGMAIASHEIVAIFLGDKWLSISPIIALLSLYGLLRCAVQNMGSIFIAINKPKIPALISLVRLVIIVPLLFYFVTKDGALGAATAILYVAMFTMPVSYFILSHFIALKLKDVSTILVFPLFASMSMYGFIQYTMMLINVENLGTLSILLLKILIGVSFYGAALYLYCAFFPKNNIVQLVIAKTRKFLNLHQSNI